MTEYRSSAKEAATIDRGFRQTTYADYLDTHPRWTKYQPEHLTDDDWRSVLHADTNSLDHAKLMIGVTNYCMNLDENQFGLVPAEVDIVYKAVAMQDWGKSYDDETSQGGDIAYDWITPNDIDQRKRKFHTLYDQIYPEGDVKEKYIIAATIYDRNTKLGNVFDAIRRLGYFRIALMAYNQAQNFPDDPVLTDKLNALAVETISNQLIPLVTHAEEFPAVKQILTNATADINALFDPDEGPSQLHMDQRARDGFDRTREIWERSTYVIDSDKWRTKNSHGAQKGIFTGHSSFAERYIPDNETLAEKVAALRTLGLSIVLTSGSFDLSHIGHARYLERAAEFGDMLIVGVDSDEKIKKRKGPNRPIIDEMERLQMLAQMRGVGILTLKDADEKKWGLIKLVQPDVLIVTAETYNNDEINELEKLYCGKVVVLEPQATTSTSARVRALELQAQERGRSETTRIMGERIIALLQTGRPTEDIITEIKGLMNTEDALTHE